MALVYHGPGMRSWEDKPMPAVEKPTDAVLKIARTTICTTDLHILAGEVPSVAEGRTLGHEGVGVRALAIRDDYGSTGIIDCMQELFPPINTICWYCHRSNSPDGKVADQILRGAVKVDAYPVPLFNPKYGKSESNPVHLTS